MRGTAYCASIIALCLASCKPSPPETAVYDGFTQGTTFHIVVKGAAEADVRRAADSIFAAVDRSMSLFDPESLVSRINRGETDSLDAYIADCITIARGISEESGGLYDITVKPLTAAYGFAGGTAQNAPDVDSLLQFVGYDKVSVAGGRIVKQDPRVQIDLNSVAQGYTVDLIARHFDMLGYRDYLVEMGGEIFTRGTNRSGSPWVVGIDRPEEGNNTPGANVQVKINLSGRGLATSGNYRKFHVDGTGRKVVHTVNPLTGEPVAGSMLSATVVAPSTALADVYGTLFMVAGLEKSIEILNRHPELAAYIICSGEDGGYEITVAGELDIRE